MRIMRPRVCMLILGMSLILPTGVMQGQTINHKLEPYLKSGNLPAVAAAVVDRGVLTEYGVVGTRKMGADIPVTIHDKFHLGSDGKAMTATIAGMMIEEGKLKWDSTLGDVFPELKKTMAPGVEKVTLEQLLSHTSGMRADDENLMKLLKDSFDVDGDLNDQRYWLLKESVKLPLVAEPSKAWAYNNRGYTIAGAMIERVSGKAWDELIVERIFEPFELTTAGLGTQSTLGKIDAPLGHVVQKDGKVKSYMAGPNADNSLILGPAGTLHLSILDLATWAGWNAGNGTRAPCNIVKPEMVEKIHTPVFTIKGENRPGTPPEGKYAHGWGWVTVDWAPYPLLYHGGSNGKNLAQIWIDKKKDIAIVIMTNIGGQQADDALRGIAKELYQAATAGY
ncbi:serine hydrolase domain-containing protein [Gimesia maris]|uniref:D-alanyl-D-alanine carboxypeptidase n=2 Tax=Gimesia maris TaxID=122 RepID=A0ABX5YKX1_9PLAN|nr:serine hydrolase domain-containing protein [Gimesia maris]QEG16344.1 D-alanyl-D-alanine carboxypeptidase precursor [Gimesia maris]QGQ30458.1 beta-lactamase family protein [Gimesia maris]